jgi:hypothetical protein
LKCISISFFTIQINPLANDHQVQNVFRMLFFVAPSVAGKRTVQAFCQRRIERSTFVTERTLLKVGTRLLHQMARPVERIFFAQIYMLSEPDRV